MPKELEMGQRLRSAVVLASACGLAACSDAIPTAPNESPEETLARSAYRGLDGEFTRLAEEIPGFGGMYYGADGRLNVVVAPNATSAASVTRALAGRAGGLSILAKVSGASEQMVTQQGDYDFAQLSRWYGEIRSVLSTEGVVFTDIDEARNRLRIGILADASEAQVRQALAQFDVPAEAIEIEVTEPIVPLDKGTLRERVQPFAGGLQLVFPNPMPGFVSLCTLGFNILREAPGRSVDYFVTNSHCTETRGVVDNTPYYQQPVAVLDPQQLIAHEVFDPPFFSGPFPICYTGYVCRYSDAAIARYVTKRTPVKFGAIYRTQSYGFGGPSGSLVIGGDHPDFFTIKDEEPFPMLGEVLDKMGRTTGWTRGPVIGTCLDVGVSGTNIAMLCQDYVNAGVAGGDSGSPVFQQQGDSKDAKLYGILWGGSGNLYVFSAMENIRFELGEFRTH